MVKFWSVFSARHVLVASLALNVSLVLRGVVLQAGKELVGPAQGFSAPKPREALVGADDVGARREVHAVQKIHLSPSSSSLPDDNTDRIINLDHGDPTMYEKFWKQLGHESTIVIPGWQSLSYFSDPKSLCWFLEPEFAEQVIRLHAIVGNAVTQDRHIVVGTGSTQLYQAVLYALCPHDAPKPASVVSAAPFYSAYWSLTECLKSGLYKWEGDARNFNKEGPYIELVTSPNNPDGHIREPVVNRSGGILVHDLAYYWPQYIPISHPADHDIMLFTLSKTIGHAGMRIGWALVKDQEVAKKMVKYIELSSIGVSKDSQLRAAKLLKVVSDSCEHRGNITESFFEFGYRQMTERWRQLRAAVQQSGLFSLPEFTLGFCNYFNRLSDTLPAFAWLKCEGPIEDCEAFLRKNNILTRSGKHFGDSSQFVRISMLDRDENIDLLSERLSTIKI